MAGSGGESDGFDLPANNAGMADPVSGPIEKRARANRRRLPRLTGPGFITE